MSAASKKLRSDSGIPLKKAKLAQWAALLPLTESSTGESLMAKKFKPIPAVPFDVLIKGHESVDEDREKYGSGDPTVSVVRALRNDHQPEEIMAVSYRLGALAKLIREGKGKPWTFAVTDENYHMVNEALFRAAARAPLFEARTVGEVSFDLDSFTKIALEETETEGRA
jgi:hypothetical protein